MSGISRRAVLKFRLADFGLKPADFRLKAEATLDQAATLDRAATLSPAASYGANGWVRVHRMAMACRFEVVLPGEDARHVTSARRALDEADRLERQLSVFRESSDLVRVNRLASESPVQVPGELYELLDRCCTLHRATDGAFDITSTPLSRRWGFMKREGRLPAQTEIDDALALVGMQYVALDPASRAVRLRQAGVELNLGAIGKGFALDRMAAGVRAAGVRSALLSAGHSSLCAVGAPRGSPGWRVDITSTVRHEVLARVTLNGAALGTSGAGEQFVEVDGVRYGHVIDPRTGWPASAVVSASVVTRTAADADALSTAFLVGGADLARRYCESHGDVLAIVTPDEHPRRPQVFGACAGVLVELA